MLSIVCPSDLELFFPRSVSTNTPVSDRPTCYQPVVGGPRAAPVGVHALLAPRGVGSGRRAQRQRPGSAAGAQRRAYPVRRRRRRAAAAAAPAPRSPVIGEHLELRRIAALRPLGPPPPPMGVQVPVVKVSRVSPTCLGMSPRCRGPSFFLSKLRHVLGHPSEGGGVRKRRHASGSDFCKG